MNILFIVNIGVIVGKIEIYILHSTGIEWVSTRVVG